MGNFLIKTSLLVLFISFGNAKYHYLGIRIISILDLVTFCHPFPGLIVAASEGHVPRI